MLSFKSLYQGLVTLLFLVCIIPFSSGASKEFTEEFEKDFPLRSIGQLEVKNFKGNVQIQGWSLDKIRIKAKKRVMAASSDEAKHLLERMTYRFVSRDGKDDDIEISNQYTDGLSIKDRLKEKDRPSVLMDFVIFAPARLKLKAWVANGGIELKNWNAPIVIRSNQGAVVGENIKAKTSSVFCNSCGISLKNIDGSLHCIGGEGKITLEDVKGPRIYSELTEGSIYLSRVQGDQLYVAKRGNIEGESLSGKIEFQSDQASINFKSISGYVSGTSEKGNIAINVLNWIPKGQSLIESSEGNIALTLPWRVSADLDIWSPNGRAHVDFPLLGTSRTAIADSNATKHWVGRLRDGGELLKVFTKRGDIQVYRSSF